MSTKSARCIGKSHMREASCLPGSLIGVYCKSLQHNTSSPPHLLQKKLSRLQSVNTWPSTRLCSRCTQALHAYTGVQVRMYLNLCTSLTYKLHEEQKVEVDNMSEVVNSPSGHLCAVSKHSCGKYLSFCQSAHKLDVPRTCLRGGALRYKPEH